MTIPQQECKEKKKPVCEEVIMKKETDPVKASILQVERQECNLVPREQCEEVPVDNTHVCNISKLIPHFIDVC